MDALEAEIRAAHGAGDLDRALTLLVEGYGGELMGFLSARLRSEDQGGEVFAITCEKLWKGLPGFLWTSSARGWAYAVARNAMVSYLRGADRRPERRGRLSQVGEVSAVVDRVRTQTAVHLKTTTKTRMQALRGQLPGPDQTLLILPGGPRPAVDRGGAGAGRRAPGRRRASTGERAAAAALPDREEPPQGAGEGGWSPLSFQGLCESSEEVPP